jgi:hypothetical protein
LEVGVVSLVDAGFDGERASFALDNGLDELHGVVDLENVVRLMRHRTQSRTLTCDSNVNITDAYPVTVLAPEKYGSQYA